MFTESNIPKGKGLSSSSADILSLLHALCIFYNTGYTTEKIYELAVVIEPTDPCLHADHLLFNQKQGEIIQSLDTLPFKLIYFDSDNDSTVDTISFSQSTTYTEELQQQYEQLCKTIALAFANSDYTTFHNCLITSAEINNCFLPKKNFHILQDFANAYNTGLFVAHSGTYMGLTVEPARFNTIKYAAFDLIKKNWNTSIYTE